MSKLDELIKKLCPDGVEYKRLSEVFITRNGYTPSKSNSLFWENGTIPWFRMDDIRENGHILSKALKYVSHHAVKGDLFPADSIIVATSATIGEHALITVPSLANQRFTYLILKDEWKCCFDIKFIFYYCYKLDEWCLNHLKQGNFASVDMKKFADFKFPILPLEVQREIVKILDNFTELTAKLTAELTARKKQYEYYRNRLLTFDTASHIKKVKLGDVAKVTKLAGFEFTKYVTYVEKGHIIALRGLNVKNGNLDLCDVKYIDGSDLSKLERSKLHVGDMLFTYVGTIGQVALIDKEDTYYLAPNVALIRADKNVLLPEYMRFYFQSSLFWDTQIKRLLQSSSMKNIPMEKIRKFELLVPPIDVQRRLVHVLDNFDKVCNDLHIGLPAEIEARKKQYEFYRDSLLTFLEKGESILTEQNRTELRYALIKLLQYVFGYVTVRISDVAETNIGLATSVTKYKTDKGVQLLHNSDIQPNRIVVKNYEYVSPEFAEKNYKKLLHKGDIITVHTGDVGTSAVIGDEFDGAIGFTTITTKIHNTDILMPAYLCHFLNSQKCKRQIAAMTISDRNNLNQSSFEKIRFEMPNLETQREIVRVLKNMDDLNSDISSGLPAEIEARKKQYEYYRDKLLSFKEKKG